MCCAYSGHSQMESNFKQSLLCIAMYKYSSRLASVWDESVMKVFGAVLVILQCNLHCYLASYMPVQFINDFGLFGVLCSANVSTEVFSSCSPQSPRGRSLLGIPRGPAQETSPRGSNPHGTPRGPARSQTVPAHPLAHAPAPHMRIV